VAVELRREWERREVAGNAGVTAEGAFIAERAGLGCVLVIGSEVDIKRVRECGEAVIAVTWLRVVKVLRESGAEPLHEIGKASVVRIGKECGAHGRSISV
jgi:hypothetical protein